MPIDSTHCIYKQYQPYWEKCRHAIEGEDCVKAQGVQYLPSLEAMEGGDYESYKNRAMFYGATARTVTGLAGAILGKPPEVDVSDAMKPFLDSIGSSEQSLVQIAHQVLEEVIGIGRAGLLVDAGAEENSPASMAIYFAENIVNWRAERVNNVMQLVMVILKETREAIDDDGFEAEEEDVYRELRLKLVDNTYKYSQQMWKKDENAKDKTKEWIPDGDEIIPQMKGGRTFDFIPFTFINSTSCTWIAGKPPVLDLVNVNYGHYRNSADLEHGRHFTALPTAWTAGFGEPGKQTLRIGSQTAWMAQDPSAKANYLEFTGNGLGSISTGMQEKEKLMAVLGARLLEEKSMLAETATAVMLRQSGEASVLALIAACVSEGISKALRWVAQWMGFLEGTPMFALVPSFNVARMDAQTIAALMTALQSGVLSWESWFYNLKRGEIVPDARTEEEEQQLIAKNMETMMETKAQIVAASMPPVDPNAQDPNVQDNPPANNQGD